MITKEILVPDILSPFVSGFNEIFGKILIRFTYIIPERIYYYHPFYLLKYDLSQNKFTPRSEIVVTNATLSDIGALSEMSGTEASDFKRRLDNGDVGFVARDCNGRYAGYKWLEFTCEHFEEHYNYTIKLPPNSAWTYDHFVHPDFREKGIWKALTACECNYADAHGINYLYCYVGRLNIASIKAQQSIGFQIIRNLIYVSLFGIKVLMLYSVNDMSSIKKSDKL